VLTDEQQRARLVLFIRLFIDIYISFHIFGVPNAARGATASDIAAAAAAGSAAAALLVVGRCS